MTHKRKYTPCDRPLLSTNKLSSLAGRCDFRDVDRHLCRANADTESVDDTADDKHGNVLRGTNDDASNHPDDGTDLNCHLAAKAIRKVSRAKSGKPRTSRH